MKGSGKICQCGGETVVIGRIVIQNKVRNKHKCLTCGGSFYRYIRVPEMLAKHGRKMNGEIAFG